MLPSSTPQQRQPCRIVVASAGYGKTTALRGWYPAEGVRWHRGIPPGSGSAAGDASPAAERLTRLVIDEVEAGARHVVIDDLPRLPARAVRSLTDALGDLPDMVSVALSSRWPLATVGHRFAGGRRIDVGPADLALSVDQVADLMTQEYDLTDQELPGRVQEATAGWPVLVHLAAETLHRDGVPYGPLLPALADPDGPVAAYLTEEVFPTLPTGAIRLIRRLGDLAPVSVGLCQALGHRRADEAVRLLSRTGLLTRSGAAPPVPGGPAPEARVVPVVAEVVRLGRRRTVAGRTATTAAIAADWYDRNGPPIAAARAFLRAGQPAQCARVLDAHGDALLAAGYAGSVVELVTALPAELCARRLRLLYGDALRSLGDLAAASRLYETIAAASTPTGGEPRYDTGLTWRIGRIHYQRGDARAALEVLMRANPAFPAHGSGADGDNAVRSGAHGAGAGAGADGAGPDAALLAVWTARAQLLAGDTVAALAEARRAVSLAASSGHDEALATAYVALALCLGVAGDTAASEEHYRLALPIAERAGDVILLTQIFTNRTYHLLRAARYVNALASARRSARYAMAGNHANLHAIAICNEADALAMLGRFDDAVRKYDHAIARYHRLGSRRTAGARLGLAEVYRRRGWREQARIAYEQAVRVAEEAAIGYVLVSALAGLALVLLADEPAMAAELAARAAEQAGEEIVVPALLAQGWVALHEGDRARAGALATEAARLAGVYTDRAALADALELRGVASEDPARAGTALREAYGIWAEAGATVEAARILVALGQWPGAGTTDRLRGLVAAEQLSAAGALVEEFHRRVPRRPVVDRTAPPEIVVRALGRFEVRVAGEVVPASRWQSRKARDLLRILVARRGRPVPRDELCELLWPDDSREKTGHRLSVLLSIVRGVFDPGKTVAVDHYLVADQASIALDVTRVRVDVEEFLAYVGHARRLVDGGDLKQAGTLLATVERHYEGDGFEDEPYAEWSGPLREEVRAAHLSMLRMLARISRATAGPEAAVGYLLRLLDRDPYDEATHRALVRSLVAGGQHGEARRAFSRYDQAMRAIGVRPPDPAILLPVVGPRPGRGQR